MSRIYTPDAWALVEVTNPTERVRKVFAGWYGGYTGGDSWKLSSEVVEIVDCWTHYEFKSSSGSIYVCYKTNQRLTGYMNNILSYWQTNLATDIPDMSIEVVTYE